MNNLQLQPFNYHIQLKNHFKERKKTWDWFKEKNNQKQQIEDFKANLLKNSYRLDPQSHPKLYQITTEVCNALSMDAQVTLYQENNSIQLNAGISIINKEAHIVLSGNIISLLNQEEMKALLAHELSHYLFYKIENEDFETTNRIILALANDNRSENATIETARVFQLYMELFCDAGALKVCNNYKTVIQMLVKINTGLTTVNADSYLKQAQEIIKQENNSTLNDSHPESYIRSVALYLRFKNDSNYLNQIKPLIERALDIDKLDVFKQKQVQTLTNDVIQLIIKPSWMNSSLVTNLCLRYFPDFKKASELKKNKGIAQIITNAKPNIQNYLSYLLLDFAKIDSDLEGAPLAHTLEIAELLEMKNAYEKTIRKELKLSVKDFKTLNAKVAKELIELTENKKDSIYND